VEKIFVFGGKPLGGEVSVSGSKNASLAIMAASLLVDGPTILHNVPEIRDIFTMAQMLREVGARVHFGDPGTVEIDASTFRCTSASEELVRKMRASFYVFGPMLARLGAARVPQPGGCDIGARPVDFHVKGMQALGANVHMEGGIVCGTTDRLRGARIYLDFPSAGATTHLMSAASLADGITTIENAATEPEIGDLAMFLSTIGAQVHGAGTSTITIQGVPRLASGQEYRVIPDRMEAGTFACAAAITAGNVVLRDVVAAHLHPVLVKLRDMGVGVRTLGRNPELPGDLRIVGPQRTTSVDILAMPHPGFPTDMQQPMVALLSVSKGSAMVTDRVFENRFRYVGELQRMGADIRAEARTAWINGVDHLTGASVTATDLRAGAALIVAALAAHGETTISGVEHIDRGYGDLVKKLKEAGADIVRFDTESPAPLLDDMTAVPVRLSHRESEELALRAN
jgi:UDP-N-acetylglucosamine 1-carboxyvinyltransferase